MCGLVESTCGATEGTAAAFDAGVAEAAWSRMLEHVRLRHCAACSVCGEAAAGIIELATGAVAPWLRRLRVASPLHALRTRRRANATQRQHQDPLVHEWNEEDEDEHGPPPPVVVPLLLLLHHLRTTGRPRTSLCSRGCIACHSHATNRRRPIFH